MTALDYSNLTRRQDPHRASCWRVWWTDVCIGWVALAGTTNGKSEWQWSVAMEPGMRPGEGRGGSADDFEAAKAAFLSAWLALAKSRTDADFEAWRAQRDFTAWKYRMRDAAMPMPTKSDDGRARCFCGAEVTIASVQAHIRAAHRETA